MDVNVWLKEIPTHVQNETKDDKKMNTVSCEFINKAELQNKKDNRKTEKC